MSQDLPAPPTQSATPQPWGVVGSIVWGAAGIGVWFVVQFAVIIGYLATRDTAAREAMDMRALASDGFLLAFVTIVAGPAWVAVSAVAARWRGWAVRDYLALVSPRRSEIVFGIACLAVLEVASDLLTLSLGRDVVPPFMIESYSTARASGTLVLFFIAVVIVAPIAEEVAFRGFLFRGLSESWLGVAGTIFATSGAWTAMHVQYDVFTLSQIFCIGLLFGWLRWASRSTLLTIVLHMLANLAACVQAAVKVEWMT